jgi:hypothetical protein
MSAFHMLQAELRAQENRLLVAKCVTSGALTPEKANLVNAEIDARAAADMALAKAIRPGPSLQEIVRHGYFSDLPRAPFQRAAGLS